MFSTQTTPLRALQRRTRQGLLALVLVPVLLAATGCAGTITRPPGNAEKAHLPLLRGWFEGQEVLYVTTDASDPDIAKAKQANYAPLLANALAHKDATGHQRPGATDRVYGVTNHDQASIFASAATAS